MNFKLILVVIEAALISETSGNTDLSNLTPNIQEEWFNYLKDPNRATFRGEECNKQVDAITSSLMRMEDWALQMFDASSKLQSGILQGNLIDFGDFSQCLKVQHVSQELGLVKGQHCLIFTDVDLVEDLPRKEDTIINIASGFDGMKTEENNQTKIKLSLGFATCLPAVCSASEIKEVMNDFLGQLVNSTVKDDYDQAAFCTADEPVEFRPADIACITLFSLVGLLMILSTCYDIIKNHIFEENSPGKPLFLAFSVLTNGKKLFAVNAVNYKSKGNTLHCLDGIRAIGIVSIVILHCYLLSFNMPMRNKVDLTEWISESFSSIVYGTNLSVDTFFVLSGLLRSYIFLKTVTKTVKFNVPLFYIHRYLRLTPPLAAMIFFQATLLSYFGNGPYWKPFMKRQTEHNCIVNWWTSLLYIQNYLNPGEICVGQSWFLAVDMQLFVLSPLILVPLWKWAKAGLALGITLILASMGIVFAVTYINEFPGGYLSLTGINKIQTIMLYMPTHTRFGPWLIGILLGYLLHVSKTTVVTLNWMTVACGWLASMTLLVTVLFGVHTFYQLDEDQDLLAGAFYQTFSRVTWSLSLCWIIFACTQGYGGPVNWFLSLPFWQPISRLSFCLYLTHTSVQRVLLYSMKQPYFFSDFNMIYKFWGDFGISLCASVLLCLAFESPITVLEKVLFHSKVKPETVLPTEMKEIENENIVLDNKAYSIGNEANTNGL